MMFIADKCFLVRSDLQHVHSFLRADTKDKVKRNHLLRWVEFISGFDYDIEHIKGKHNYLADYLSREFHQETGDGVRVCNSTLSH